MWIGHTHAHTHTYTHIHTRACIHTCAHTCTNTDAFIPPPAYEEITSPQAQSSAAQAEWVVTSHDHQSHVTAHNFFVCIMSWGIRWSCTWCHVIPFLLTPAFPWSLRMMPGKLCWKRSPHTVATARELHNSLCLPTSPPPAPSTWVEGVCFRVWSSFGACIPGPTHCTSLLELIEGLIAPRVFDFFHGRACTLLSMFTSIVRVAEERRVSGSAATIAVGSFEVARIKLFALSSCLVSFLKGNTANRPMILWM